MNNFEEINKLLIGKRKGIDANKLQSILRSVYSEATKKPENSLELKNSLLSLATFLTSPEGRTREYCNAVDYFFMDPNELWTSQTLHLAQEFKDVLDEFSFLHGAKDQPEYHTTPEELKEMIEKIGIES